MIEFCWEDSFLDEKCELTRGRESIGFIEPCGSSWRVVYGMETIAIRPDKASAQSALTKFYLAKHGEI
jgi:hypothetical protein